MQNDAQEAARPLQFFKALSLSVFALILGFSLLLSVFISNIAEESLLEKQKQFGDLLAENISHQVWTRFALPALIRFGAISLRDKDQFGRLDQVIRATIHSFHVRELRIYDKSGDVTYSFDTKELGKPGKDGEIAKKLWESGKSKINFVSQVSKLKALVSWKLKPGSMQLEMFYPLRAEQSLDAGAKNPIMGILVFRQDITDEYLSVVKFQRLIVTSSMFTSMIMVMIIMYIMRRAERSDVARIREKEELQRELHQQEKLAGMGRMVAGIAHEIRNPLGIIRSSAELVLKKAKKEGSSHVRLLDALLEEADRLSRTVGEFLDYARPRNPNLYDVDLGKILDQVAVFLEPECEKLGVTIERDYRGEYPSKGDKDLLYRAFYNIVSNALQSIAESDVTDGHVVIRIEETESGMRVMVEDNGPGFGDDCLDKVCDPFFTTKDTGTGLGLAITTSILESHGAQMHFSNGPQGGARVSMTF